MKTIDRSRQKDRRQKRAHSVSSFCFVVFRPQSLLDILESRVMKRMSINHCAEVDAMANSTPLGYEKKLSANIHQTDPIAGRFFIRKSNKFSPLK